MRIVLGTMADIHPLQDVCHALFPFGGGHAQVGEGKLYVLRYVQFVYQIEALEYEADVAFAHVCAVFFFQVSHFFFVQIIIA